MNHLFTPIQIQSVEFRNRIVMAPMCMYSAEDNGFATPWHVTHYETRAVGGTGLVIIEATAVEPRGRISSADLGIWSDDHIEGLKNIVDAIHRHGAKAGIQLAHAGRKCGILTEAVIAPSPICFDDQEPTFQTPHEMTQNDIDAVVQAFTDGARRAEAAGFDVIELHGAHGYLINEFLSPLTNERQDRYGYATEQGTIILQDILKAVTQVWPNTKPIFLRVSAEDYVEGGNTSECISTALNRLKDKGIDVINVSSGGVVSARVPSYDGYQTRFAEIIKASTEYKIMSGGRIKTAQMADEIIRNDRADLVFIGRQLLIDPYFALHAAVDLKHELDYSPIQYDRWKTSR